MRGFALQFFLSQRELHSIPSVDFFVKLSFVLSQLDSSKTELQNVFQVF